MPVRVVLLCVCGCPGSGKTTLAKALVEELGSYCYFYTISFDTIERQFYGEYIFHRKSICREEVWRRDVWKRSRLLAYRCIQTTIRCIQGCNGDINAIKLALSEKDDTRLVQVNHKPSKDMEENDEKMHIVIADDTFHLRSMRRTLVRICQECVLEYYN